MIKGILFALAITLTGTASAAENENTHSVSPTLISELNTWLDTRTEFAKRADQPKIEFVGKEQAETLRGVADRSGGRTRGLYDAATETIYLTEPWSPENMRDISVLLHEITHHRQAGQHWYCEQAQEWRAYQIQAQWLEEHGIEVDFYWPAILLQSSCAKRDIHPG